MVVKVILNPASDQGRAREAADKILAAAAPYGGVDMVMTEMPGHARELARMAVDEPYDLVVAAGGDGTVHEVVNGLMQGGGTSTALGVIPIGSGNDFAFANGISTNIDTAVSRLFAGETRLVDLARIEDEYGRYALFDNNFGLGFDAVVVIRTEAITRIHGFMMYFVAVLQTIALYYQSHEVQIDFDGEQVSQAVLFLAMGVGPRGGGGFFLTPDARADDNLIDSCTVKPIGRLTMLGMLLKAIKGTHVDSRHLTMRQNRQIRIKTETPMPIHIDGEIFAYPRDNVRRVTITSLPAAIRLVV